MARNLFPNRSIKLVKKKDGLYFESKPLLDSIAFEQQKMKERKQIIKMFKVPPVLLGKS